jgi:phosphoribosylanthranilate isomerase
MTWVKVCGLTVAEDVTAAVTAGADAIGLVNVPSSPRFIPLETAFALADGIPVPAVLLTMDFEPDDVLAILHASALAGVQPYGRHRLETARAAERAGYLVLFPLSPEADVDSAPGIPLLDTPSRSRLGGTGEVFDWAMTEHVERDFVLAGGLGPDNVAEAVRRARPWGVDASSRLEISPGRKDHGMVADFIERAKAVETR